MIGQRDKDQKMDILEKKIISSPMNGGIITFDINCFKNVLCRSIGKFGNCLHKARIMSYLYYCVAILKLHHITRLLFVYVGGRTYIFMVVDETRQRRWFSYGALDRNIK